MRAEAIGFKVEQHRSITAIDTIVSSLAKETRGSTIAESNRAYSNGKS